MALSTSNLHHHPLYYWCLPQAALYIPCMKNIVLSANMTKMSENQPLSSSIGMSILTMLEKIGLHLWTVIRKVMHHCMIIPELLNSNIFLMCTEETMAMAGKSKKNPMGLEAQEWPGWEAKNLEVPPTDLKKKTTGLTLQIKNFEDPITSHDKLAVDTAEVVLLEWLDWESEEEENKGNYDPDDDNNEDDVKKEQCAEDVDDDDEEEWSDEEDSDWSDDDGESEASAESTELWECFFNNDNPLYFSCSTGVKAKSTNTTQNCTTSNNMASDVQKSTSADVEEHNLKESTKKGTKKVQFSEEVKVHHLLAWSFASRAARDGSCWLEMARDRERFRRRVQKTGEVLNPCLTAQHRDTVWNRLQKRAQQQQS